MVAKDKNSRTERNTSFEKLTSNPVKYKMDNSILIVSICQNEKG